MFSMICWRHVVLTTALLVVAWGISLSASAQEGAEEVGLGMPLVVDIEFQDETLENALFQILFEPGRFKIIGRPDVPVTGAVRAITLDDAMQQLEDLAEVLVVRRGEKFTIYSADAEVQLRAMGRDAITYVYRCRKTRAGDLINVIENKPPPGFPTPASVNKSMPSSFDAHRLATASSESQGRGLVDPLGAVEYQVVPNLNGIVLKGALPDVREAVDFLRVVDHPIPIVLIEVLIVQYSHQDGFTWRYNLTDGTTAKGTPYNYSTGTNLPSSNTTNYGPKPFGIDFQNIAWDSLTGGTSFAYSGIGALHSSFKQNLTLLMNEDLARIVTNPHVAVTNGQTGVVLLDEKYNFNNTVSNNNQIQQKADSIDSMTALHVTPTVVGPDAIHLAVNTLLSSFGSVSDKTSNLPGQIINQVGTSVSLGENETLILGGLVKEATTESREKIPGAARIPLLGHFFRAKKTLRHFSETVVYITPHLAQPQGYEDAYRKQILEQNRRLQQLGEEMRTEHRMDKDTSNRLYRHNEKLDRRTYHQYLKDGIFPGRGHHRHAGGYYYYEDGTSDAGDPTSNAADPFSDDPQAKGATRRDDPAGTVARTRHPQRPPGYVAPAGYDQEMPGKAAPIRPPNRVRIAD